MPSGRITYPARVVELFAVEDEVVDRVGALADRSPWELLKRLGYPAALLRASARNAAFDVDLRRIVTPLRPCYQDVADAMVPLAAFLASEHGVTGKPERFGGLIRRLHRQPGMWLLYENSPQSRSALSDVATTGRYATWSRQGAVRANGDDDEPAVRAAADEVHRALARISAKGFLLVRSRLGVRPIESWA